MRRLFSCDNIDAIADAALAGAGLARLPYWLAAPKLQSLELVHLLPEAYAEDSDVHLLWPRGRFMPHKTRLAADLLAERVPALLRHAEVRSGKAATGRGGG